MLFLLVAAPAIAGDRKTVFVESDLWQSDLLITTTEGATVELSNCRLGPLPTADLSAGQSSVTYNFAGNLCTSSQAGIVDLETTGDATIVTVARFNEDGRVSSFEIPQLENDLADGPLAATLIQNEAKYETAIALFNIGELPVFITATIYDQGNAVAGTESFQAAPGELTLYHLTTFVAIGRVELEEGLRGIGAPGVSNREPVYGFVLVNWREGGSPRVRTLEPIGQ